YVLSIRPLRISHLPNASTRRPSRNDAVASAGRISLAALDGPACAHACTASSKGIAASSRQPRDNKRFCLIAVLNRTASIAGQSDSLWLALPFQIVKLCQSDALNGTEPRQWPPEAIACRNVPRSMESNDGRGFGFHARPPNFCRHGSIGCT